MAGIGFQNNVNELCRDVLLKTRLLCFSNVDEEIQNLDNFSTEMVVKAAGRCLKIIQPELDISESLPHNMAARFHVGSALAQACKVIN